MPILVEDVIDQAAGLIGALTQGTGLNQSEKDDGFFKLNVLVDEWNADPLKHYAIQSEQHTLASHTPTLTMGPGGTFSAVRPVVIESAAIILDGLKHPMELINKAQYNAILEPLGEMKVPRKLYDDGGFPMRTCKLWPVPSGTPDLEVNSPFIIQPFAALNSAVSLPPAYLKALIYTLATDLAPSFRLQLDPSIPQIAAQAQAAMKVPNVLNAQPALRFEDPAGGPSRGTATPQPQQQQA
jgi:hypothetical protein